MLTISFTGVDGKIVRKETLTAGMVGRQVMLEFSPEWDGLSKTVVFSAGSVTRDAIYTGGPVTIPAEVLAKPLMTFWVGVYGVSADGQVVIPTVRTAVSVIQPGADPSGDSGTEPDLPVWAQLQTQLDKTGGDITELQNNISGISVLARYVSSKGYVLSIDTNAMKVRIPKGYVFLKRPRVGQSRLTVEETICTINTESEFSFVAMNVLTTREVVSINPANFDATTQVVLAVLWNGHYTDPAANWIMGAYQVDGKVYNDPAQCSSADEIAELQKNISNISVFARFVTSKGYVLSIDTNAMTIRIPDGYVFYKRPRLGQSRLPVADTTCAINTESAFSFVVMDVVTKAVSSIKPDNFDATAQVVLAVLWKGHYTDPAANWIMGPYQVNGFLYNAPVEQAVYVATTGDDSNVGDRNNPLRTIKKAVASGAKTIFVFPGTYRESISASRTGGEIEILGKPTSNTNKDVVLDLGQELVMTADSITGLVKAAYAKTANDFIYKAFVSKSETLVYDDGFLSNGYACNLWRGNTKLRPVLTLAECQAAADTWFYDGANVYANAEAGTFTLADGAAEYGIHLSYFKKVKLMGIDVRHAKMDGVRLEGCTDAEISRCRFSHSGLYTGLALNNTSATVRNCEAMYNRTDGLNIHGVCTADFIDCVSHDNWDDGISHHDQSGGMILGGEYYRNGKGGVCSPTFGSRNSVSGVYIHDNASGVYTVADAGGEYPPCTVSNCTIVNNTVGVRASRYPLVGWNNTVSGNENDVVEENGGTWTVIGGGSSGDGYTLPVATPNRLGGVKPVAATDEMTQPVGVTPDGELVTAPGGGSGGGEVCDLLMDVTITERVSSITQSIDNVAYKKIFAVAEGVYGHADNSADQRELHLKLTNAKGVSASIFSAINVSTGTTQRSAKVQADLTDKMVMGSGQANNGKVNQVGLANSRQGTYFYEWNTNVLQEVGFVCSFNTMEAGARFRIWGVRV